MAWNMPQFLEIHIIKRYSHTALEVCAEQPCGCPGSILAAIITQHCVQNKCRTAFCQRSVRQLLAHPDADAGTDDRDDEGRDAAGGVDAHQTEHEFAHKAAQDAHEDVAAE